MATVPMQTYITRRVQDGVNRVDIWYKINEAGYVSCDLEVAGNLKRVLTGTVNVNTSEAPSWFTAVSCAGSYDVFLYDMDGKDVDVLQGIVADAVRGSTEYWSILPDASSSFDTGVPICGRYKFMISDGFAVSAGATVDGGTGMGVVRFFMEI